MANISVVIPMYNAREWIEETLKSVLAQTYPAERIETIVIDDRSNDDSVAVAKAFLARHRMAGRVIKSDRNRGVNAARNTGWRAANGDWIQFLDADDLLAPNKIELQAGAITRATDDIAVICSSWQRLGLTNGKWQPYGLTIGPELDRSAVLRVLTFNAGFLGPALIRKRMLEVISGFSDEVKLAEDSRLLLKIAAEGGKFIEARSALPTVFIRQVPSSKVRAPIVDVARQHMEDVVAAERLLREKNFGELSAEDGKELGRLSDWALSELYRHDQAAFRQYLQWVLEVDPTFVPKHSSKLEIASRILGYENAEGVALVYRRMRAWLGATVLSSPLVP
jgi:glycosyltransferase involved in cell wall biosynthesis